MCDFCKQQSVMESVYADLKIDVVPFYGNSLTIFNIKKGCPPFSECSGKDRNIEVHFEIKYCPMCGKKL